ncbi:MAG: hypothetical protein WBM40_04755 [Thiohalocapsa sp.]|jgi:hypothetical protein
MNADLAVTVFFRRRRRSSVTALALCVGLWMLGWMVAPTAAETWQGQLQQGGQISVDPYTHRAMRGDGRGPMWDGVHRLDDGSTVIIRQGIAIPTEQMYETWSGDTKPQPIFEDRHCNQLVRKTCGFDSACNNSAACLRARSLLGEEGREQRDQPVSAGTHPRTAASEQCRRAMTDPAYAACASLEAAIGDSRCRDLVDQVCGADDRCAPAQPCGAARQLLRMETEERLTNDDPGALSATGGQCLEAMINAFFIPCDPPMTPPDLP